MRVVDLNKDEWKLIMDHAAGMGRNGDSKLVHINNAEEKLLKEAGGAGTTNPKTGLKEYYQPEGGAGKAADTAGGSRKSGIDKDRPGKSTDGGNRGSDKADRVGPQKAKPIGNATVADFAVTNKQKAIADFAGEDDTFFDKVANFFGGMFGVREMNPASAPLGDFLSTDKAQWGVDPIAAGLSVASALNPVAAVASKLYGAGVNMGLVDPHMVGLGYDKFGAYYALGKSNNSSGGANGGKQGGKNDPGNGRPFNSKPSTPAIPSKTAAPATPAEPTPVKTPGEILLDKYKLPSINAPWALQPYQIDRSQHNAIVQQAMQRRVDTSGDN